MKSDVERILGTSKNCMQNKVRRKDTRMPMIMTDTPREPSEKIPIDLIGTLSITPRGNQFTWKYQCVFSKYSDVVSLKMMDSIIIAQE